MFSAGYSISHQGSSLGAISWHFQCRARRLEMKKQPRTHLLSKKKKQKDTTEAAELHCCLGLCVCVFVYARALGVVLLNVANSDAHADGSTEMVSVSKVPLAVRERKEVSAANAFEHSRFQINFPCCLLGRRRWGLGQAHSCWKTQPQLAKLLCFVTISWKISVFVLYANIQEIIVITINYYSKVFKVRVYSA